MYKFTPLHHLHCKGIHLFQSKSLASPEGGRDAGRVKTGRGVGCSQPEETLYEIISIYNMMHTLLSIYEVRHCDSPNQSLKPEEKHWAVSRSNPNPNPQNIKNRAQIFLIVDWTWSMHQNTRTTILISRHYKRHNRFQVFVSPYFTRCSLIFFFLIDFVWPFVTFRAHPI